MSTKFEDMSRDELLATCHSLQNWAFSVSNDPWWQSCPFCQGTGKAPAIKVFVREEAIKLWEPKVSPEEYETWHEKKFLLALERKA